MENIINRIIEIDKNATDRLNVAQSQKKLIISDATLERTHIREAALKKADEQLAVKDKAEKMIAMKELDAIALRRQEALDKLNISYDKNHENWEAKIFAGIVGE